MPTIDDAVRAAEAGDLRAARATAANLAKAGDPVAMRLLGHLHLDGSPAADDIGLAAYWFFQAWQAGLDEAERDIVNVRGQLEHAAGEAGSAEARVALGLILAFGHDAPAAAAEFFRAAADQDQHPEAARMLALLLAEGRGVAKDEAAARAYYQLAADAGDPFALFNLAGLLDAGAGGPRDRDAAIRCFRRAADAGMPDANHRLAELLAERNRDRRDANEAVQRLMKTAQAGPPDGAYRIAAGDGSWVVLIRDQGRSVAMPGLKAEELVGLPDD